MSCLVYLLVWSPPPHIPYISSPNQCLLFAAHVHTIATCFAVVSILYHLLYYQLDHMQIICTSLQTDNHTSTSPLTSSLQNSYNPRDSSPQYISWHKHTPTDKIHHHHQNSFTALFPGPPGWASARRKILLDFTVQGKITRGRHTNNPGGHHSIRTNQWPSSINPPFLCRMPFLWQPSQFILAWERHRNMLDCIVPWLGQIKYTVIEIYDIITFPRKTLFHCLCFLLTEAKYSKQNNNSKSVHSNIMLL